MDKVSYIILTCLLQYNSSLFNPESFPLQLKRTMSKFFLIALNCCILVSHDNNFIENHTFIQHEQVVKIA